MTMTESRRLLDRMFAVEMRFLSSPSADLSLLAEAFDPEVEIIEPSGLPYAGCWKGLDGVAALLAKMHECWSKIDVTELVSAQVDGAVLMHCRLSLTARRSGEAAAQPFAERLVFRDDRLLSGTPFYFDTVELAELVR